MSKILPNGNPKSPIWVVCEKPYDKDADKGTIFSGGYGYSFFKCWRDSGIKDQPFITSLQDLNSKEKLSDSYSTFLAAVDYFKPPFILPMGKKVTALFCPFTKNKHAKKTKGASNADAESSLEKYAGSLLTSPDVSHSHYVIPLLSPDALAANFAYRTIYVQIDLGHVREETDFYRTHQSLQPLPKRTITLQPTFPDLMDYLKDIELNAKHCGNDIETIRPKRGSFYYGRFPGHLYTIALATSIDKAISFCPWEYSTEEIVKLFRQIYVIHQKIPQIGQNFFTFDSHYYAAYGIPVDLQKAQDTMLRHQILWPEFAHKLQFLTKHYTRQPYYKDEGKGWSPKNKKALMHYNALDAMVTLECYFGEENEFDSRPYLR